MQFLQRHAMLLLTGLVVLTILDRLNILFRFAFKYTDSDQALLWVAAQDLLKGEYHGLCFYGQKYNPLIEPFFALPLLYANVALWYVLPIITGLLSITPFLLISYFFFRRYDALTAAIPLLLLLLLPPEYLMLTSMPRGFVTGVFFGTIGILLFIFRKEKRWNIFAGVFMGIGLFASPNSILLFPLVLPYIWKEKEKAVSKILYTGIGLIIGLMPFVYNYFYYKSRPEMIMHGSPSLSFHWSLIAKAFEKLDIYFDHIAPVFWRGGWISLLIFITVCIHFWRKNRKAEFTTAVIMLLSVLLSLGIEKVNEATNSVYFSGARMFLAYPVMLIFLLLWFYESVSENGKAKFVKSLVLVGILAFATKILHLDFYLKEDLKGSKNSIVEVTEVDSLQKQCAEMMDFAESKAKIVLAVKGNGASQLISYGCPCLVKDFPQTVQPYERRTWLMPGILENTYPAVLLHGDIKTINKLELDRSQILKEDKKRGWILIQNDKTTANLSESLNIRLTTPIAE